VDLPTLGKPTIPALNIKNNFPHRQGRTSAINCADQGLKTSAIREEKCETAQELKTWSANSLALERESATCSNIANRECRLIRQLP
jgi:hypothetical protein